MVTKLVPSQLLLGRLAAVISKNQPRTVLVLADTALRIVSNQIPSTKNPPSTGLWSWRRTSKSRSSLLPRKSPYRCQLRRMLTDSLATPTFWHRRCGTRLVRIRVIQTRNIWTKMSQHSPLIITWLGTCRGITAVSQTSGHSTWFWKEEMRINSKIT